MTSNRQGRDQNEARERPEFTILPQTKLRLIQRSYLRLIVDLAVAFTERYGEEAWEILKNIAHNIGQERTPRLRERFNIDPTDVRSIVNILAFETAVFLSNPDDYKLIELSKNRKVAHVFSCAQAEECRRLPDMCMRFFDYIDQATYEELGVKIKHYDVPLRIAKGDPYCETILEIEGDNYDQTPEGVTSTAELPRFDIPVETRIRLVQNSYMRIIVDMAIAFTNRWGEDAWKILKDVAYRVGLERTGRLRERFQIDPTDARSVTKFLAFETAIFLANPDDYKLIEFAPKRHVAHVFNCAQAQHISRCPDLCMKFFDYIDQATYEQLGVKIKRYDVPLRLSKGDPYCETILEIE